MDSQRRAQVDRFVVDQIDSVPHLEALLLLFNSRPKAWSAEEMARALYVRTEAAARILDGLLLRGLIAAGPADVSYYVYAASNADGLIADLEALYRREVVRISSLIHSRGPASVRDFARAFRFTKDKD